MNPLANLVGSQKHIHLLWNRLIPLPGVGDRQINSMDFTAKTNRMSLCPKEGSFLNMDSMWNHSRPHSMFESSRICTRAPAGNNYYPLTLEALEQCYPNSSCQILIIFVTAGIAMHWRYWSNKTKKTKQNNSAAPQRRGCLLFVLKWGKNNFPTIWPPKNLMSLGLTGKINW